MQLVRLWADTQQQVLTGWLDLVQGVDRTSRAKAWTKTVDAWQTAVQETLDAQANWLRDWTGRAQVTSGSPTELRKNVQEAQEMLLKWTEAQQQLWLCWFNLIKQLGPVLESSAQMDEILIRSLRDSGRVLIDAQTEWVRRWTTGLGDRD
ncbi:MAG TPA: hypothetical protein VKY74_05300 [Chloroflexia bacterium]|nr:hypothetical protein [Chloroflexia bacterium]